MCRPSTTTVILILFFSLHFAFQLFYNNHLLPRMEKVMKCVKKKKKKKEKRKERRKREKKEGGKREEVEREREREGREGGKLPPKMNKDREFLQGSKTTD